MTENLENAKEELKRIDHLIYVTLKYTRTVDVLLSVVERMIKLSQEKFGYVQALVDCNISIASINKAIGISDYFKGGEIDEKDR